MRCIILDRNENNQERAKGLQRCRRKADLCLAEPDRVYDRTAGSAARGGEGKVVDRKGKWS